MRLFPLALAVSGALHVSSRAAAAPHAVRLTFPGDPATSVAVSWNSDDPTDAKVFYGTAPDALTREATAIVTAQPAPLVNSFTAVLTGLSPNTTYFYKVGKAGALYPAQPYQFTTLSADPCAPMRFVLIGDNRQDTGDTANSLWGEILAEALVHAPQFFVNTGDMVKDGENATQWASFLDMSESGFALVPSLLTMGNHDEDQVNGPGALYNQLFELPTNESTDDEDYYSLDVGPIHFVSLNTQHTSGSELAAMKAWLEADLAATRQPWKIVFFHKAIYTRGNHSTGEESNGILNQTLVPIFDAHDVDLVLNGHSHDYERYAPSVGVDAAFGGAGRTLPAGDGTTVKAMAVVPDGTVGTTYIVSGGAGALVTDIPGIGTCIDAACTYCTGININCDGDVLDLDRKATVVYEGRHNFAVIDVVEDTITVEVWATDAGNDGAAEKIDAFVMKKSTFPLACGGDSNPGDAGPEGEGPDGGPGGGGGGGGGLHGAESGGCSCRVGPSVRVGKTTGIGPVLVFVLTVVTAFGAWRRRSS